MTLKFNKKGTDFPMLSFGSIVLALVRVALFGRFSMLSYDSFTTLISYCKHAEHDSGIGFAVACLNKKLQLVV